MIRRVGREPRLLQNRFCSLALVNAQMLGLRYNKPQNVGKRHLPTLELLIQDGNSPVHTHAEFRLIVFGWQLERHIYQRL